MSCDVGGRLGLNLALLWLWCRLAAIALIQPLAWEPPHVPGVALKRKKKKKKKRMQSTPFQKKCNDFLSSAVGVRISLGNMGRYQCGVI